LTFALWEAILITMQNNLLLIIGLSFLGSIAGLIGGLLLIWKSELAKKFSLPLISFAAGVMLAATFLEILPEAVSKGGDFAFLLSLIGLVIFFLVEDFFLHFHHHEQHEHSLKSVVPLLVVSDTIHNFIDGIVIAAAVLTDIKLGFVVAFATFLHEIPQEIGDFAVMISAGISKTKTLLAHLLSACATFAGALLTYYFFNHSQGLIGPMIAVASGMFLYIASADILPELTRSKHAKGRWVVALPFLLGIVLIYFLTKYLPD
jgi:zinc and cadmium transporter